MLLGNTDGNTHKGLHNCLYHVLDILDKKVVAFSTREGGNCEGI